MAGIFVYGGLVFWLAIVMAHGFQPDSTFWIPSLSHLEHLTPDLFISITSNRALPIHHHSINYFGLLITINAGMNMM